MNRKHLNLNLVWTLFLATLLYCGAAAAHPLQALADGPDPTAVNDTRLALGRFPTVLTDGQPTL